MDVNQDTYDRIEANDVAGVVAELRQSQLPYRIATFRTAMHLQRIDILRACWGLLVTEDDFPWAVSASQYHKEAFMHAVRANNRVMLQALMDKDKELGGDLSSLRPALDAACELGRQEMVADVLGAGVDARWVVESVCRHGSVDMLRWLAGEIPFLVGTYGRLGLEEALISGNESVFEALLDLGATVPLTVSRLMLQAAIWRQYDNFVRLLLLRLPVGNLDDMLLEAIQHSNDRVDIVRLLLDAGANLQQQNGVALTRAVLAHAPRVLNFFLGTRAFAAAAVNTAFAEACLEYYYYKVVFLDAHAASLCCHMVAMFLTANTLVSFDPFLVAWEAYANEFHLADDVRGLLFHDLLAHYPGALVMWYDRSDIEGRTEQQKEQLFTPTAWPAVREKVHAVHSVQFRINPEVRRNISRFGYQHQP